MCRRRRFPVQRDFGENIAFGVGSATDSGVRARGGDCGADIGHRRVSAWPPDTVVGERGITLSGGQKQRTAIARALLRDPRILILDDALASVDTATEERILSGLAEVMRGRTTILISHRVSTIQGADKIVVLEKGEVAAEGDARGVAGAGRILRGVGGETDAGGGVWSRRSSHLHFGQAPIKGTSPFSVTIVAGGGLSAGHPVSWSPGCSRV